MKAIWLGLRDGAVVFGFALVLVVLGFSRESVLVYLAAAFGWSARALYGTIREARRQASEWMFRVTGWR